LLYRNELVEEISKNIRQELQHHYFFHENHFDLRERLSAVRVTGVPSQARGETVAGSTIVPAWGPLPPSGYIDLVGKYIQPLEMDR